MIQQHRRSFLHLSGLSLCLLGAKSLQADLQGSWENIYRSLASKLGCKPYDGGIDGFADLAKLPKGLRREIREVQSLMKADDLLIPPQNNISYVNTEDLMIPAYATKDNDMALAFFYGGELSCIAPGPTVFMLLKAAKDIYDQAVRKLIDAEIPGVDIEAKLRGILWPVYQDSSAYGSLKTGFDDTHYIETELCNIEVWAQGRTHSTQIGARIRWKSNDKEIYRKEYRIPHDKIDQAIASI